MAVEVNSANWLTVPRGGRIRPRWSSTGVRRVSNQRNTQRYVKFSRVNRQCGTQRKKIKAKQTNDQQIRPHSNPSEPEVLMSSGITSTTIFRNIVG